MNTKKNIAVVAGGNSSEYVISLQSAEQIAQNIDRQKYDVFVLLIKGTQWEVTNDRFCGLIVDKNDFSFRYENRKIKMDAVFMAIHGTPGEDGKLQSYFDMLSIPYVGSDVLASALTFNKFYCNTYLRNFGINMAKSLLIKQGDEFDEKAIADQIGFPMFIKPNAGGSSFGISKVNKIEDIGSAIEKAFKESHQVIIEEFISGQEFTQGIIRTKSGEIRLPITEVISNNDFFDFEAKYDPTQNQEITPARLSDELAVKCQEQTSKIAGLLNCKGISRIDYILKDQKFYFLEINTVPGMSKNSLVPQQIRGAGYTEKQVFTMLLDELFE